MLVWMLRARQGQTPHKSRNMKAIDFIFISLISLSVVGQASGENRDLKPETLFSQVGHKQDTVPAVNIDTQIYQKLLNIEQDSKEKGKTTIVFYNDKLYLLSDFYLPKNEIESKIKSIRVVNHPDSIKEVLSNKIKSIIIIDQ